MKTNKNQINGIVITCFLALLITITACKKEVTIETTTSTSFDMVAAQKAIDSCNANFTDAFNKGDATGVANCYTSDAKFMPPNTIAKEGMKTIKSEVESYFKAGLAKLTITTKGLWGNEELLIEEGIWTIADKDGKELDHGKSLLSYKKEGGHWKIFRDCYNSDMPCGTPPPPAPEAEPAKPKAPPVPPKK